MFYSFWVPHCDKYKCIIAHPLSISQPCQDQVIDGELLHPLSDTKCQIETRYSSCFVCGHLKGGPINCEKIHGLSVVSLLLQLTTLLEHSRPHTHTKATEHHISLNLWKGGQCKFKPRESETVTSFRIRRAPGYNAAWLCYTSFTRTVQVFAVTDRY